LLSRDTEPHGIPQNANDTFDISRASTTLGPPFGAPDGWGTPAST
jgi:hypothetical protein